MCSPTLNLNFSDLEEILYVLQPRHATFTSASDSLLQPIYNTLKTKKPLIFNKSRAYD